MEYWTNKIGAGALLKVVINKLSMKNCHITRDRADKWSCCADHIMVPWRKANTLISTIPEKLAARFLFAYIPIRSCDQYIRCIWFVWKRKANIVRQIDDQGNRLYKLESPIYHEKLAKSYTKYVSIPMKKRTRIVARKPLATVAFRLFFLSLSISRC